MRIGLIGAGKVGISLSLYSKTRGATVVGVSSRTEDSAARGSRALSAPVFTDAAALLFASDVLFLAVPDDKIAPLAVRLAEKAETVAAREPASASGKPENFTGDGDAGTAGKGPLFGKTMIHFSGALGSVVLSPLAALGAAAYSVHPPLSFAEVIRDAAVFDSLTFTAEGSGGDEAVLRLFPRVRFLRPGQKPAYHAAMCVLSNFSVALAGTAEQLLSGTGLSYPDFLPLIYGTIENVARLGPGAALTGPAARGDAGTIQAHLAAIGDGPEKRLYTTATEYCAWMALKNGKIKKKDYDKLMEVLKNG